MQKPTQAGSPFDEYLILDINHHIKLLEMVQYAMEKLADDTPIPWDDLKDRSDKDETAANQKWRLLQNYLAKLLQPGGLLPDVIPRPKKAGANATEQERDAALAAREEYEHALKEQRAVFMGQVQARMKFVLLQPFTPADYQGELLLQKLDQQEWGMLGKIQSGEDNSLQLYSIFPIVDSYEFPLEYMSGMETDQTIHTVRIAQLMRSTRSATGAWTTRYAETSWRISRFSKKSWRANDIMWEGWMECAS